MDRGQMEEVAYEPLGGNIYLKNPDTGRNLEAGFIRREAMDAPNKLNYGVYAKDHSTGDVIVVNVTREVLLSWLSAATAAIKGDA